MLVLDGRGEAASHLAGVYRDGQLTPLYAQELPHSLGLLYEDLTGHLGFLHSSDEYKVMALASYGRPRVPADCCASWSGRPATAGSPSSRSTGRRSPSRGDRRPMLGDEHADLAAACRRRLEEVLLDLAALAVRRGRRPDRR